MVDIITTASGHPLPRKGSDLFGWAVFGGGLLAAVVLTLVLLGAILP